MADCQSCGMPLAKDPAGGGTNADGSKSSEYCGFCYRNGKFTEPELSCDEMVRKARSKMKEMKIPALIGWFVARKIPKLKRWTTQARLQDAVAARK